MKISAFVLMAGGCLSLVAGGFDLLVQASDLGH